jgi:hypothetical protein
VGEHGKMKVNEANNINVTMMWHDDCVLAGSNGKVGLGHGGQGQQDEGNMIRMKSHDMCGCYR